MVISLKSEEQNRTEQRCRLHRRETKLLCVLGEGRYVRLNSYVKGKISLLPKIRFGKLAETHSTCSSCFYVHLLCSSDTIFNFAELIKQNKKLLSSHPTVIYFSVSCELKRNLIWKITHIVCNAQRGGARTMRK